MQVVGPAVHPQQFHVGGAEGVLGRRDGIGGGGLGVHQHADLAVVQVGDGGFGAAELGTGHGVAGDVAGAVGVRFDQVQQALLGGANVDDGLVLAHLIQQFGQELEHDVDGGGEDDEIAHGQAFVQRHLRVDEAAAGGLVQVLLAGVYADDAVGEAALLEGDGQATADQSDSDDGDGHEAIFLVDALSRSSASSSRSTGLQRLMRT